METFILRGFWPTMLPALCARQPHLNRARSAIAPLTTVLEVALKAQPNSHTAQYLPPVSPVLKKLW